MYTNLVMHYPVLWAEIGTDMSEINTLNGRWEGERVTYSFSRYNAPSHYAGRNGGTLLLLQKCKKLFKDGFDF